MLLPLKHQAATHLFELNDGQIPWGLAGRIYFSDAFVVRTAFLMQLMTKNWHILRLKMGKTGDFQKERGSSAGNFVRCTVEKL